MKRRHVLSAGLVAAAVGFMVAIALADRPRERVVPQPPPEHVYDVFADSDNPLGVGPDISLGELQEVTKDCGVCTVPETGAESLEEVAHAWHRSSDGVVAIDFVDGLRIYFSPDGRSNDEYQADMQDLLEEDKLFSFIELRGMKVIAHERGDSELSPASLAWIEDGYRVEIIGHGGQELSDLIASAESLGS